MTMDRDAALWSRVGELVADRLGLHFPADRLHDLQRGLHDVSAELGLADAHACATRILADGLDPVQARALASHLTIGETYFLRGEETFAALRDHVLPGLIRARAGDRRLRLWSAACATGEEAYSLAIVLRQLLPDIDEWDVEILATDVNPRALRKAREGVYGGWSFRGTPASFRARWFRRTRENRHALAPEITRMVTFAPLNLVDDSLPPVGGGGPVDVVLCRNVLMYFTPAQATRAVAKLRSALATDGWLVVAPCEVSRGLLADLEPVRFDGAILHRKAARSAVDAPPSAPQPTAAAPEPVARLPAPVTPRPTGPLRLRPRSRSAVGGPAVAPVNALPAMPASPGKQARALADQGRLAEALDCCDRWLQSDKLAADAHYLRAMILTELDRPAEARAALQRCVYLEPDAPMVSFALGNLERRFGRHRQAGDHYRQALHLVQQQPPTRMLDHAEGVSAAQLAALIVDLIGQERRA